MYKHITLFLFNLLNLQGQSCLRKCSSDEDCKSKKKHCLCDGLCGMSCVKPGKIVIILNLIFSKGILPILKLYDFFIILYYITQIIF